jgi:hypothetical protein
MLADGEYRAMTTPLEKGYALVDAGVGVSTAARVLGLERQALDRHVKRTRSGTVGRKTGRPTLLADVQEAALVQHITDRAGGIDAMSRGDVAATVCLF